MKKIIVIGQLILSLCCGNLLYAAETTVNHIRHSIVNNLPIQGVDYELNDPNGMSYKGALGPKQIKIINFSDIPEKLYGPYSLSYRTCEITWWGRIVCNSTNKLLFIKKNVDVIWEITPEGLIVTESAN